MQPPLPYVQPDGWTVPEGPAGPFLAPPPIDAQGGGACRARARVTALKPASPAPWPSTGSPVTAEPQAGFAVRPGARSGAPHVQNSMAPSHPSHAV